jgi:hypothetical protein
VTVVYLVKPGGDHPLIDLVAIDPQPRSDGLRYTRRQFSATGGQILEGAHVILEWDVIESQAAYEDLLEQFDLDAGSSEPVTITLPGDMYETVRYNGIALRPVPGETVTRQNFFIRDVKIIIRDLEVAS